MGLDTYIDHSCAFRPDGGVQRLTRMLQSQEMGALMDRHGRSSLTLRRTVDGRAVDQVVHRSDVLADARALQALPAACAACPAGVLTELDGATPGCRARLGYPVDDVAVAVVREALQLNADQADTGDDLALVRSLVAAGDCDGQRMHALVRRLGADPAAVGHSPVDVALDGRVVPVTAYMLLEHICFRRSLDAADRAALLRWFRYLFQAAGERIAAAADAGEADPAAAVFGRSRSLVELTALRRVVERAHARGRGLTLDG